MFDWTSLASKGLLLLILVYSSSFMFSSKKWSPEGLHVYITGGSQGLGLALAKLVARKGAHVSIVARTQSKLDDALKELEANRQSPDQVFKAFSFSLNTAEESAAALQAASDSHSGKVPDAVFACAGAAKPMYLLEMQPEDLSRGMANGYWIQAWTAFQMLNRLLLNKWCARIRRGRSYWCLRRLDICLSLDILRIRLQNMLCADWLIRCIQN